MRLALLIAALIMPNITLTYAETTLTFEQRSSSQIVLHARATGTLEVWVDNKVVVREQLLGSKDYFFSATAVVEASLDMGTSGDVTATWIGSNQIFFNSPYDQVI